MRKFSLIEKPDYGKSVLKRRPTFGLRAIFTIFIAFAFLIVPSLAYAQTATTQESPSDSLAQYVLPSTDSDVPRNLHTLTQVITIEVISSVVCALTGQDLSSPNESCLGINPKSEKVGYDQTGGSQQEQIGGVLGAIPGLIGTMYTPTTSTGEYISYMQSNFGIVHPAYAAANVTNCFTTGNLGYSFCGLSPILDLWTIIRNVAYSLLILAFILIGFGVMLRIKIDPRTVMTIQNQIPRVVVCIILITFSYAIAAFMADIMWLATYVGINLLTVQGHNPAPTGCPATVNLQSQATYALLEDPFSFVNNIFKSNCTNPITGTGLWTLSFTISGQMAALIETMIDNVLGVMPGADCLNVGKAAVGGIIGTIIGGPIGGLLGAGAAGGINFGACLSQVAGFFVHAIMILVVAIVLIVQLFRVWFELLKAYFRFIVYTITGPLVIAMGLLPGRPLGFEKWLRILFTELVIFPAVVMLLVFARILMDAFNNTGNGLNPNTYFIPPLVGDPNLKNFGALIAFGAILLAPTLLHQLRESMKAQPSKYSGNMSTALQGGFAMVNAVPSRQVSKWTRRDPNTGAGLGVISGGMDKARYGAMHFMSERMKIPFSKKAMTRAKMRSEWAHDPYGPNSPMMRGHVAATDAARQRDEQPGAARAATLPQSGAKPGTISDAIWQRGLLVGGGTHLAKKIFGGRKQQAPSKRNAGPATGEGSGSHKSTGAQPAAARVASPTGTGTGVSPSSGNHYEISGGTVTIHGANLQGFAAPKAGENMFDYMKKAVPEAAGVKGGALGDKVNEQLLQEMRKSDHGGSPIAEPQHLTINNDTDMDRVVSVIETVAKNKE